MFFTVRNQFINSWADIDVRGYVDYIGLVKCHLAVCTFAHLWNFLSNLLQGGELLGQGGELVPPAYARPQNLCFSQPIPPSATPLHSALHCRILPYTSTLLCQAALHFQVHRARILMELFDQRESLPVVGGRHVALGAAPHMTTFARLSPISNSHPFDFLTPPPHTMSKQHMHEI